MGTHRWAAVGAALALALAACAQAGTGADDGEDGFGSEADAGDIGPLADASPLPTIDASEPPAAADAAPGQPDAAPTSPDATPTSSEPDAAPPPPMCPTSPCDLVEQCGCASGQACDLDVGDLPNTRCRSAGTGTEVTECDAFADCAAQHVCVTAEDSASCKQYCATDADCPGVGRCVIDLVDGTTPIEVATVCSSDCNPSNSAAGGCPSGWGCYPGIIDPDGTSGSGDELVIVDCSPTGTGTQGTSCTADADCAADFACIRTGTFTRQCLRICDTAAPNCTGGTSCELTDPALDIGSSTYGICI